MKIARFSDRNYIPASHEDPHRPGVLKKVLLQREDFSTGRLQMLNWSRMEVGQAFRPHYHEDMEEVFVMVRGQVEFKVGQETVELRAGDAVLVPMLTRHEMRNIGQEPVEYLVFGLTLDQGGKTINVE